MTCPDPIPDDLRRARTVAIAHLDRQGTLLAANAGFLRLAGNDDEAPPANVAHLFFKPSYAELAGTTADGMIHEGKFSIGAHPGPIRTLTGRMERHDGLLRFWGEPDIEELEEIQEQLLRLNLDLAEARREVARMNRELGMLVAMRTAALSASEARFRTLVEQSLVSIGIIQNWIVRYANPALATLAGYSSADEMSNQVPFLDLVDIPFRAGITAELKRLMAGELPSLNLRFQGLRHGVGHPAIEGYARLCDYDGRPAVIIILLDITERQRADDARNAALAEAERLSRLKSQFINNISHELRTPLHHVIGMAGIGGRADHLDKARDACQRIGAAGKQLLGLVENVLDFSAAGSGTLALTPTLVDLGRLLDRVVAAARQAAADKELVFREERTADLPRHCTADPWRMEQVLTNLLDNAIKFTEAGSVDLSVAKVPGWLVLRVADTGIGIAPSHVERLFRPFEQADGDSTRRHGGAGLGLALIHHLITRMGGTLRVQSTLGVGTTFEVRLPLIEVPPPP